jgi:sugar phosphate isomerase/epimerase
LLLSFDFAWVAQMKFPIALQTYTVRRELERDIFDTLQKIAEIGYHGVELSLPLPGANVSQVKNHLNQIGLEWVAYHVNFEQLASRLDDLIASLHTAGCGNLVLSYLTYSSKQDVIDAAQQFNEIGANCRKQNIQFLYHNHHHEFIQYDGERALDILVRATDPELVKFELDTYWVRRGGEDPANYLRSLRKRCPLLHVKDMEQGPEQFFAEVGEGILDFEAIFHAAQAVEVQWLIVEQDESRRPAFESIAISYRNLKKMGVSELRY